MNNLKLISLLWLIIIITISACNGDNDVQVLPTIEAEVTKEFGLSDEQFSLQAKEVCQDLRLEIDSTLNSTSLPDLEIRFERFSNAYRSAYDELVILDIHPDIAPQAAIFVENLMKMADWQEKYATVFSEALIESLGQEGLEIKDLSTILLTQEGQVICVSGVAGKMFTLNIDQEFILEQFSIKRTLDDAANALGLDDCIVE